MISTYLAVDVIVVTKPGKQQVCLDAISDNDEDFQPNSLMPFAGNRRQPMPPGTAFNLLDYIELLEWTGRQVREGKRGSIDTNVPPVLQRINISPAQWLELCTNLEDRFKGGLVPNIHSKTLVTAFGLTGRANRSNSILLFS